MTRDSVDFVRQGAFIALGMILIEQSEASSPSFASTRAKYAKVIADKHEDRLLSLDFQHGLSEDVEPLKCRP